MRPGMIMPALALESSLRTAIVILTYNGVQLIDACLQAVYKHTNLRAVAVVVVDNASTDGTADHVAKHYPDVQVVRNPANLGFAGGVNAGIAAVSAQHYVLLNSDALVTPGWLTLLEETAQRPDHGIVGAIEVSAVGRARFPEDDALLAARHKDPVVDVERVSFACALLRRDLIQRIGLLDHAYFMYHEDWDYCHRAQLVGFRTVVDARVEVVHAGRGSFNQQPGAWRVRVRTASRQRYQLLHWSARKLWASIGHEIVLFAYWTKEGHPLAYLQGSWATLRAIPEMRRRRRELNQLRRAKP